MYKVESSAIYSDSMVALQTVTNLASLHQSSGNGDQRKFKNRISAETNCTFVLDQDSCGVEGNEKANHLAKETTLKRKP